MLSKITNKLIKCVQKIPYKFFFVKEKYIVYVNRSNKLDVYIIKNHLSGDADTKNNVSINIFVDLEQFYKKKNIWPDVLIVKKNIYNVFEKNFVLYFNKIKDIIDGTEYSKTINLIISQKETYKKNLEEFKNLLNELCLYETNIILKIQSITKKPNTGNVITYDIENSQEISKLEMMLARLNTPKQNMIKCFIEISIKLETIYVVLENICFHVNKSIVKIYKIFENLKLINIPAPPESEISLV